MTLEKIKLLDWYDLRLEREAQLLLSEAPSTIREKSAVLPLVRPVVVAKTADEALAQLQAKRRVDMSTKPVPMSTKSTSVVDTSETPDEKRRRQYRESKARRRAATKKGVE
jgi:hypothetical protein